MICTMCKLKCKIDSPDKEDIKLGLIAAHDAMSVCCGVLAVDEKNYVQCFSCESEFVPESYNDRDEGWFCDECFDGTAKR